MNYYLCAWNDASDGSHTIIKQGQNAVSNWLRKRLLGAGISCPARIIDRLDTLDGCAGIAGHPIQITWTDRGRCSYTITEITDLGVFDSDEFVVIAKDSFEIIVKDCRAAWNWLHSERFNTQPLRKAQEALKRVLCLFRTPVQ